MNSKLNIHSINSRTSVQWYGLRVPICQWLITTYLDILYFWVSFPPLHPISTHPSYSRVGLYQNKETNIITRSQCFYCLSSFIALVHTCFNESLISFSKSLYKPTEVNLRKLDFFCNFHLQSYTMKEFIFFQQL